MPQHCVLHYRYCSQGYPRQRGGTCRALWVDADGEAYTVPQVDFDRLEGLFDKIEGILAGEVCTVVIREQSWHSTHGRLLYCICRAPWFLVACSSSLFSCRLVEWGRLCSRNS